MRYQAGQAVRVTGHQFRHTLGTRLIKELRRPPARRAEVARPCQPQHDRALCQGPRQHRAGSFRPLPVPTCWHHRRTSRILPRQPDGQRRVGETEPEPSARQPPNRYCARPAQQECPHPSACLTCPDFQTTPEFLEVHRRQAATNRRLIAQADAKGQFRLAENLRQVQANLGRIIPALETIIDQEGPAGGA